MFLRFKTYDKVLLVFFVSALIASFLIWTFEERFDQDNWSSNQAKRYQMADDIIDSKLLIGKTKREVLLLLGEPEILTEASDSPIIYKMGKAPSFSDYLEDRLIVVFKDGVVIKVIHSKE